MRVHLKGVHEVRKRLADGSTAVYRYAWRGGPRLLAEPGTPAFVAEYTAAYIRQRVIAENRAVDGVRLATNRVRREWASFANGEEARAIAAEIASKLVRNARHRAVRKKLACDITIPDLVELLRRQRMVCALSGLPFDPTFNLSKSMARNPFAPSIDRLDNSKGYVAGNVRVVLAAVNYGLNEWGLDAYRRICAAVTKQHEAETVAALPADHPVQGD